MIGAFRVRDRLLTGLVLALSALAAGGCGGGSGGGGGGGSLNFHPVWEQRGLQAGGAAADTQTGSVTRGSFGADLPAAVTTIRITFESDAGMQCCLAVNPGLLPIDPESGRRFLVLGDLPAGGGQVGLAGFAVGFAPIDDALAMCPTAASNGAQPCDPNRVAAPSFQSDPQRVNIVSGVQNDAGDIPVFAVPFVFNLVPDVDGNGTNPLAMSFVVADASTGIDRQSVSVEVSQNGQAAANVPLTLTACDDTTGTPCSGGGALHVSGFRVSRQAQALQEGDAAARIQANNLAATVRALDLSYSFSVPNASATPTPGGTPGGREIIVHAGANIRDIARAAPAGSTLIVAPGLYSPVDLQAGDLAGSITFVADPSGLLTDSPAAAVTINVRGSLAGFHVAGQSDVTIDGFTIRGASSAGVLIEQSAGIVVQNCAITDTRGDGVRIDETSSALALNNLIFGNSGSGIEVHSSDDVRLINNTLYQNGDSGIVVGDAGQPSSAIVVRNNIVNLNTPTGFVADLSTDGYDSDYNLNTDSYAPDTPRGVHDVIGDIANPLFIAPSREDFHLATGLFGSRSPAVDGGDPAIDAEIAPALSERTTQTDGSLDTPPIDLGYHYPPPLPTPTPKRG
jgi:parallel beta-helix repeat protein